MDLPRTFVSQNAALLARLGRRIAWLPALCALVFSATSVLATSTYDYGADEYVTIEKGMSPDRKYAITGAMTATATIFTFISPTP